MPKMIPLMWLGPASTDAQHTEPPLNATLKTQAAARRLQPVSVSTRSCNGHLLNALALLAPGQDGIGDGDGRGQIAGGGI